MESMKSMVALTLSLLQSDLGVGVVRLDKAKESINEMIERIHGLMVERTSNVFEKYGE